MISDGTERTSRVEKRDGATALHPLLYLAVEGARPLAGGARFTLHGVDAVVIGRGDARRASRVQDGDAHVLRIDVPDRRMSSDHARIAIGEGKIVVSDLASTNGTKVNGASVDAPTAIAGGAILEVGQTIFLFQELAERVGFRVSDLDAEGQGASPPGLLTLEPTHTAALERLKRVARSNVSVMLLGETGTGKEVLARAVHELSRRPGPFVAINCGAIPATLVESQLFGHLKGAFSGATRDEPGLVRSANFGTLFLDEIGDLPAASQAALLRVLQEAEVLPVGATRATKVDVRVVSATHKPLDDLMARGDFRRDLFGRLAGFVHALPPLRDRRVDLGVLIGALLRSPKIEGGESLRIRVEAARAMLRYDWPLNVRELEQCLTTSSVLAEEGIIDLEHLPAAVVDAMAPRSEEEPRASDEDEAIRRELLLRLVETRGNVTEVARAMGKARQQVQRWLRRFGIDPEGFRPRDD